MGKWKRFELNENISSNFPDDFRFAGNYAILVNGECIYVGESGNILKRLKTHIRLTYHSAHWHFKKGVYPKITIAIRPEEKNFERMMIESRLIERLKPKYNKLNRRFEKWDITNGQ